jgi:hypothetical protein
MGSAHFLTKTLKRVSTEMSLHVLAYNLKRVMRIVGPVELMQMMRARAPSCHPTRPALPPGRSTSPPFGPKADESRHTLQNRFVVYAGVAHDGSAIVRWFLHSLGRKQKLTTAPRAGRPRKQNRRPAIRSGEESVLCSTAPLRSGFISADF